MRVGVLLIPAIEAVPAPVAAEHAAAPMRATVLGSSVAGPEAARGSAAGHGIGARIHGLPVAPGAATVMAPPGIGRRGAREQVAAMPQSRISGAGGRVPGWRPAEAGAAAGPAASRTAEAARDDHRGEARRAPASPWSATAWLLWRPEVAGGLAQAPLLGGSQLGARLDYRVAGGGAGQIGLYGRVSRALTGAPAEEAALGVSLRPARAPVTVLAERRQRLGRGGRNGFALLVAGGLGPREVAPRLVAEGYAQAGMVGLPGLEGFADGKASLGHRISPAPARLTLGGSISGSVQRGAGRLDIGPEMSLRLPAGATSMRLSVEWRERVLGGARPARGPAITLVGGF